MSSHQAVIGLGSNLEPEVNIGKAKALLAKETSLMASSAAVVTKAIGLFNGGDFHNCALLIETPLDLDQFKIALQEFEDQLGRTSDMKGYNSRVIDIDLLGWNGIIVDDQVLTRSFWQDLIGQLSTFLYSTDQLVLVEEKEGADCEQLARRLWIPYLEHEPKANQFNMWLKSLEHGYGIIFPREKNTKPFYLDILGKLQKNRGMASAIYKLPLVQALGKKNKAKTILDTTCGWAKDSMLFLSLGYQVTALEKSPLIALLMERALKVAKADDEFGERVAKQFKFHHVDALDYLAEIENADGEKPDIVYLDPMFITPKKKGLSNKEMQILQYMQPELDSANNLKLLKLAKKVAKYRVIVKNSVRTPPLLEQVTHQFKGRAVRYDLYVV